MRFAAFAFFLAVAVSGFVIFSVAPRAASAGEGIEICHFPPGNPANFHTITVGSQKAAEKHIAQHGDVLESCCGLEDVCDDADACTANFCIDDQCTNEPVQCGEIVCMVLTGCDVDEGCQYQDVVCDAGEFCDPDSGVCVAEPVTCPCFDLDEILTIDITLEDAVCGPDPSNEFSLRTAAGEDTAFSGLIVDERFCIGPNVLETPVSVEQDQACRAIIDESCDP